jgi:glycosyltransferase involved in cell wall biosynthesis
MENMNIQVSIVVPIFNERENIADVYEEITDVLSGLNISYEIIFVDDGSTDGSTKIVADLAEQDPHIQSIIFRRNFGQTPAFSAGIENASGNVIILMDGDRQNDPHDIPMLLQKIDEGFDVVSGWRYERQDNFLRRLPSQIANKVISIVTGVHLHDYGCSLKAYRKEVLKHVRLYGEMHRFIPALCYWHGASITELKVNHRARTKGVSKYGINRTIRVILDLLTVKFLMTFSTRPSHVFGVLGILSMIAGLSINIYLSFVRLVFQHPIANRPLLLLGILLIFVGLQFICFGLLAEMLARIYHESQNKPIYSIKKIISKKE